MIHIPEFRNLYPKSLISMGPKDKSNFMKQAKFDEQCLVKVSHWLTAYLWREEPGQFGWGVIVYPADENGSFVQFDPYFDVRSPTVYKNAKKLMQMVELNIYNDTFTSADFFMQIIKIS